MTTTPQNRIGGALLIIGTSLVVVMLALTPGLALVDFVDADDFIGMSQVVRDNAALSFSVTIIGVLGLMLQLYGLLVLRKAVPGEGAFDTIAKFGVMAFGLGVVVSVVDRTLLYTAAHTMEYGIGAGVGPDQTQFLEVAAVMLLKVQSAFNLTGFYAFLLGSIGLGVGLIPRLRSASYRVVGVLMVVSCWVSLVFLAVISPFYGLAGSFFLLFAVGVNLGNVWLIMLGVGLYRGMPELSMAEESA